MSDTRDRLKSLFRQAVHTAQASLEKIPGLTQFQKVARELANLGGLVTADAIQRDVLRVPGIASVSVLVDTAGVRIDASFEDAADLAMRIVPNAVHFAPRGAKEIGFAVEPPETTRHRYASELVAAVATALARTIWGAALGGNQSAPPTGIVDREGENEFRVDLRNLSIFRGGKSSQATLLLLDALVLESIESTEGALRLRLKLPFPL